ncbi:MAG: ferritin-like domain-containing protein [Sandaracinaceae bacterium]|nr:ferritin-like domain-containing protein [Sandaracinaceae bacterium]
MTTYERLRRLFTDLSIATLATQAAGCSETHTLSRLGFDTTSCDEGLILEAAEPASAVDYLAIRRVFQDNGSGAAVPAPAVDSSFGALCETASDEPACLAEVDGLPTETGFGYPYSPFETYATRYQLIWTRGDEVGVVTTDEELRAFLGTIDNAEEAMLIARFAAGHRVLCDGPNTRVTDEGIEVLTTTGDTCGPGTMRSEHILLIAPDGTATVRRSVVVELGDPNCVIGRLTSDVAPPAWASHADLGSYFAEMAVLEASAVVAFERLARELLWLGAPSELVARARSGRDDEARHVHQMAELAQVFGAESLGEERLTVAAAEMLELAALPPRSAFDIALENAREGCVRETYGALVATHQAQRATDTRVAETLKHIARDETHHAAFSWDLAAWLTTQLSAEDRALVALERALAVARFGVAHDSGLDPDAKVAAGLPDAETARALYVGLHKSVWA